MLDSLIENETFWRLSVFVGVFVSFAIFERLFPRRIRTKTILQRWPHNLGMAILGSLSMRLLLPILAVGTAAIAVENTWGLLNQFDLALFWRCLLAILLLDLAIYTQHLAFHKVPIFWRLHRVHHSDTEFDVSNALRFHPIEIVISMLIKMALVLVIGAPPVAVILFEIILNGMAIFNHSNTKLPQAFDKVLRWFVVTPDFHRVHHSIHGSETNSNFGFNSTLWDRIFGTYTAEPRDGHALMQVGLPIFRAEQELKLDKLVTQPFRKP